MGARGIAAVDAIVAVAVGAILSGLALPPLLAFRQREELRAAARLVAAALRRARAHAVETTRFMAARIDPETGVVALIADGDGDGISHADLSASVDLFTTPVATLRSVSSRVSFAIRRNLPDIDGPGVLAAGSVPVRFGPAALIAFSPVGHSSTGTVFLAHAEGEHAAVRVLGSTGRVRVLWFDAGNGRWRDDEGW